MVVWLPQQEIQIAEEYKARPALWDRTHPHYRSKETKLNLLTEVASICQKNINEVEQKFFRLRMRYFRTVNELKGVEGGESDWVLFKHLDFLSKSKPKAKTVIRPKAAGTVGRPKAAGTVGRPKAAGAVAKKMNAEGGQEGELQLLLDEVIPQSQFVPVQQLLQQHETAYPVQQPVQQDETAQHEDQMQRPYLVQQPVQQHQTAQHGFQMQRAYPVQQPVQQHQTAQHGYQMQRAYPVQQPVQQHHHMQRAYPVQQHQQQEQTQSVQDWSIVPSRPSSQRLPDDFDTFGQCVANELRLIRDAEALLLTKHEIQNSIFKGRMTQINIDKRN